MAFRINKWIAAVIIITGLPGLMACTSRTRDPVRTGGEGLTPLTEGAAPAEVIIEIPDVVAVINGVNITGRQFEGRMGQSRAMNPEVFDSMGLEQIKMAIMRTIDNMVIREVIYQEAVRREMAVSDEDVDMELEVMKKKFPSEEAFRKTFAEAKIEIPAWKAETKKNLMAMKLEALMVSEIKVTDSGIKDYYEKNMASLNMDSIRVSHILLDTEEEAKVVMEELGRGEDFGSLVKKHSTDIFTKDKGGDLGWYGRGQLLKEVEDAAYAMSPGERSGPVRSRFGYHITRLDEKKAASEQTLEDHRDHVRSILRQEEWQRLRPAWVKGLLTNATVWKWKP